MTMLMPSKISARWPLPLACLAFVIIGGIQAQAWEVRDTLVAEKEYLLRNPAHDILVVTVLTVEAEGATNGNPPKVELRVEEVLRGDDHGPTVTGTWQAPIFHEDTKEAGGVTEAWKARPLAGPEVGANLIVFSIGPAEATGVQSWSVYRFSVQNRAAAVEHAATERSARIQIPIFFLILALPVVIVILFVRAMSAKISPQTRRRLRLAVAALAVLTPGLYVFYESGISVYSNIRIDLIVIWPAVGAAVIVGVISLFQFRFRSKSSSQPVTASSGLLAILGKSLAWGFGTGFVVSVAAILLRSISGGPGAELAMLLAAVIGPPGLMVGGYLALLIQFKRALALPLWSKSAYGLILLVLAIPFFSSVMSVSSFVIGIDAAKIFGP